MMKEKRNRPSLTSRQMELVFDALVLASIEEQSKQPVTGTQEECEQHYGVLWELDELMKKFTTETEEVFFGETAENEQ
jgi:hypothetical protein